MKTDVAIVGAGPAGTAAAIRLSEQGFEVALFDRATFPRDKACGEFLNPAAARLIERELGIPLPPDAAPVQRVSLIPERGHPLEVALTDDMGRPAVGYSLNRVRTDAMLVSEARKRGVTVFEGHSVRQANPHGLVTGRDADDVPFECHARVVIAADGTHSLLARQRGLVRAIPRLQRIGISAHFADLQRALPEAVQMFAARRGTWGASGLSGQADGEAVLSAVVPCAAGREISADREWFVWQMVANLPGAAESLVGTSLTRVKTVPCFGHRLVKPFDEGIVFAGDAARFVDPFTGEGIHHALEGGLLAAEAVAGGLHRKAPLSQYAEARRELERRYSVCDLVQLFVHRPWLMNTLVRNLRHRPQAAEMLFGTLVDVLPPRAVWSPKVLAAALLPAL